MVNTEKTNLMPMSLANIRSRCLDRITELLKDSNGRLNADFGISGVQDLKVQLIDCAGGVRHQRENRGEPCREDRTDSGGVKGARRPEGVHAGLRVQQGDEGKGLHGQQRLPDGRRAAVRREQARFRTMERREEGLLL